MENAFYREHAPDACKLTSTAVLVSKEAYASVIRGLY